MPTKIEKKSRNIVIEWDEVKNKFFDVVQDGKPWTSQPVMGERLMAMHRRPDEKNSWEGGSAVQTLGYLRDGYRAKEFLHSAEYVPQAMKKRPSWSDCDGEIDTGRLLAGRDDFFLNRADRESRPGLRLQVEFAFASGCGSKTIQDYGAWVAGLIGSLEASGYDLVVDLWIPLEDLYQGDSYGFRSNVLVRVKRNNEVSDFTEWSVIFGPTGYRHIGFTAKCVAGDKIGKRATQSLGHTIGGKTWGVQYDKETSTVMITVNQRAYQGEEFPKQKLTDEAIEAGLLPGKF